jgi:dTDP-4-amino-4,6-dideoxygalactose transaminase
MVQLNAKEKKQINNQFRIQMVDLKSQYSRYKSEFDGAVQKVLASGNFINGEEVEEFSKALSNWTGSKFVSPCANGTDALQIAYMALGLKPGDEVIVPSFNYVAAAEAAVLLGLTPIFVDCDKRTFNISIESVLESITPRTRALVAVHLFGQACDIESLEHICSQNGIFLIEDNAQSIGAEILFGKFAGKKLGTIGIIGTTSFFPSKNLGCMGDGGAIFCQNEELYNKIQMIVNHGQKTRYQYDSIGMNSRLDTIQASILLVKMKYIDKFTKTRVETADFYTKELSKISGITTPLKSDWTSHVFHQYTIIYEDADSRNLASDSLNSAGIQNMIYYPKPLHLHPAYKSELRPCGSLPISEWLGNSVLSLPIHSEMTYELAKEISYHLR